MVGTSIDRGIDNGCICIKGDMKVCVMVCGDGRGGRGRADVVGGGDVVADGCERGGGKVGCGGGFYLEYGL